jgi:dual specificity phosphatase 12
VVNFDLSSSLSGLGSRPHLHLQLRDEEDEALLPHLPSALAFIQEALDHQGGKVLIHCQAGKSRSVSVAIAHLMKEAPRSVPLSAEEALDQIKKVIPDAEPNEGFWSQLLLFGDMRCRLDLDHPVYRMWVLRQVGRKYEDEGWLDGSSFAPTPTQLDLKDLKAAVYRCRKCRELLCSESHVLPMEAAMGHRLFRGCYKAQPSSSSINQETTDNGEVSSSTAAVGAAAASSLFVEPLTWMASTVTGGDVKGKLHCPGGGGKCGARLGSYSWSGISDERGGWVTPGFQLHLKAMDVIQPMTPQAIGIRQPRSLLMPNPTNPP